MVVVVGGGVNGLCIALALRKIDLNVTLVDPRPMGHQQGSSHGSRNVNIWHAKRDKAPLQRLGVAGWLEIEKQIGKSLFHITDCLQLLPKGKLTEVLEANINAGQPGSVKTSAEIAERWGLKVDCEGLHLPGSCRIGIAENLVVNLFELARAAGVKFVHKAATRIELNGSRPRVYLDNDKSIDTNFVVIAAGPWTPLLLKNSGYNVTPLQTSGQLYSIFSRPDVPYFQPKNWLMIEDDRGWEGHKFYCLPDVDGQGIKVAVDNVGPSVAPGTDVPNDTEAALVERYVGRFFPAGLNRRYTRTCWYIFAADWMPTIGFIPGTEDTVVLAHSCGGGGVKTAPGVGEVVAALIAKSALPIDISAMSPTRAL